MYNLKEEEKQALLDKFGKLVISEVRDRSLKISMDIVMQTTKNKIDLEQYKVFSNLTDEEREKMCDLLSVTITDTIYNFLEMIEEYSDEMELDLIDGSNKYDMKFLSEKTVEYSIYYPNGEIVPSTYEECKDLEVCAVWELSHVIDRLMGDDKWLRD